MMRKGSRNDTLLPLCPRPCQTTTLSVRPGRDLAQIPDDDHLLAFRGRTPRMGLSHLDAFPCSRRRSPRTLALREKACLLMAMDSDAAPTPAEPGTTLALAWPSVVVLNPVLLVRALWEAMLYLASTTVSKIVTRASATPTPVRTHTPHRVLPRRRRSRPSSPTPNRRLLGTTSSPIPSSRILAKHRTDLMVVILTIAKLASR